MQGLRGRVWKIVREKEVKNEMSIRIGFSFFTSHFVQKNAPAKCRGYMLICSIMTFLSRFYAAETSRGSFP